MFIYVLVYLGHINEHREHSTKEVGALINDLLVCIEMSIASVAFLHSFSVLDFSVSSTSIPEDDTEHNETEKKAQLILHTSGKEARNKSNELRLELNPPESILLWDVVGHVFSQTELKKDLHDVTAHVRITIFEWYSYFYDQIYEKHLKEFIARYKRQIVKTANDSQH